MKIIHYLLRELKNLWEFYLIPLLVLFLPRSIYFPIFKFICASTALYNKYCNGSYVPARQVLENVVDEKTWRTHVKLLYLTDIADFWLARYRPKKMLKMLNRDGQWSQKQNFMALSPHWGPGYVSLLDLKICDMKPYFVYTEPQVDFVFQSFMERLYRKARTKHLDRMSGSVAITTGGGFRKIKQTLSDGGVPIILFDAPQFDKETQYYLKVFDRTYKVASGFIHLICQHKTPFHLYYVMMDFDTGIKTLCVKPLKSTESQAVLMDELSNFFEQLLLKSPEQWYFWRQSHGLLMEQTNE